MFMITRKFNKKAFPEEAWCIILENPIYRRRRIMTFMTVILLMYRSATVIMYEPCVDVTYCTHKYSYKLTLQFFTVVR